MSEVYDRYVDTAGNYHYTDTETGHHVIPSAAHGKWMFTNAFPHHVYCSACHKTYIPNNKWQIWVCGDLPRDYCPNCGARMDGEDDVR